MKKKILALCLVVVLAVTAVTGATLAYFTDSDDAENVFTVGNVDIDLTEPKWDKEGEKEAEDAYPGEPLAKDPTVENIGKNPCFVRISITGLDQFTEQFGADAMIKVRTDYVEGNLGENWVEYNGFYYYNKVLAAGEKTDALFDQIVIPTQVTNNAETVSIDVVAQAVQAQGAKPSFSDVEAMTVEEIDAWFTTTGGF